MLARTLMVQGTASSVGKSIMVAALCRIFRRRGLRVAPFKSQNMALNSFVTLDGLEIGRAQAVQAQAAGIEPSVEMNPILLKPEGGMRSQVVLLGRPIGSVTFGEYSGRHPEFTAAIAESLRRLREKYDVVVIEGAGSPAEINLKSRDVANMYVAELANAPVILAGDIDRGGVFAQIVGTMELLDPAERARVAAFLINKFRGDPSMLDPALNLLHSRYGVPVLGIVPFIERLRIAEEDSVALETRRTQRANLDDHIDIAVVKFPAISNYDDFMPLEHAPRVVVRFVEDPAECESADLLVLPGSKKTVADLQWLRRAGFADAIARRIRRRAPVLGICGGCQMLGESILDPGGIESTISDGDGLGLLPLKTVFEPVKLTARVTARAGNPSFLTDGVSSGEPISGYEIHMGRVEPTRETAVPFIIMTRNRAAAYTADGAISADGTVAGTMIHGLFENDAIRRAMIDALRRRKGLGVTALDESAVSPDHEYDRLADAVRSNIDCALLDRIVGF